MKCLELEQGDKLSGRADDRNPPFRFLIFYPSATSRIIMMRKPVMTPRVPSFPSLARFASGISSSTTT